jgi:hypothetical protein
MMVDINLMNVGSLLSGMGRLVGCHMRQIR